MLFGAAALCSMLPAIVTTWGNSAHAGGALEERKLPMRFTWVACGSDCRGWVSAVGIVTADSPQDFEDFARERDLRGATIVLDSSGGSVNDSIALGRRFRDLGMLTTVGISTTTRGAMGDRVMGDRAMGDRAMGDRATGDRAAGDRAAGDRAIGDRGTGDRATGDRATGDRASVAPEAYCESMCVFLLLSGKTRYVPPVAHVRVHQIWMGDRADDARAASYTAQDLMIVERDIGRLAKYTFDMGGAGDLLLLALNVPPWEDLHELSPAELRLTHLVTTDAVADVLPLTRIPMAEVAAKPVQDRFVSKAEDTSPQPAKATKTAEALVPTGAAAPAK
jgi:hypothetical protein